MKKTTRNKSPLSLAAETVRLLSQFSLKGIAGGDTNKGTSQNSDVEAAQCGPTTTNLP